MSVGEEKASAAGGGSAGRRRRRWSEAQKRQIVTETHEPGVSVPMVAQRYNLNANQIFRWRRLFRAAERAERTGRFVPVVVEAAPGQEPGAAAMSPQSDDDVAEGVPAAGRMEIVLAGGRRAGAVARDRGAGAAIIPVPSGVRVWLATGVTDMRRGMNTLALQVQQDLGRDPHVGDLYVFRGRRGDLLKILWHDGIGISLYAKRLERGRFPWPSTAGGAVSISAAQLGYLLEGIEWRNTVRTWRPSRAG